MFMVEIAGTKILYTGDFSRQEDRHLMAAEIPHGIHFISLLLSIT
jgi:cleavage and polyadenylation specificity factor subunit 3